MECSAVAQGVNLCFREIIIRDLGLLKADDIGLMPFYDSLELMEAHANTVDVKRDDLDG